MTDLRQAAQQALEAMRCGVPTGKITLYAWDKALSDLSAALAQERLTEVQQEMERSIESLKAAMAQKQAEQTWVCPEAPEERTYSKPGYCKNCGRSLVLAQVKPDHETRAELAEQQVVQLAEERDHYRNLWQQAQQQAEPNVEYERGFIDGMQKQAQSSVDRAVNRMAEQAMLGVWQDVPGAVNFGIAPQAESPCACWPGRLCSRQAQCAAESAQEQAEPVQEPVAYRHLHEDGWEYSDAPTGEDCAGCQALYTAPPKLVPLTQEQLYALYDEHATYQEEGPAASGWWDFARAIERAHGIGGQE